MIISKKKLEELIAKTRYEEQDRQNEEGSRRELYDRVYKLESKVSDLEWKVKELRDLRKEEEIIARANKKSSIDTQTKDKRVRKTLLE